LRGKALVFILNHRKSGLVDTVIDKFGLDWFDYLIVDLTAQKRKTKYWATRFSWWYHASVKMIRNPDLDGVRTTDLFQLSRHFLTPNVVQNYTHIFLWLNKGRPSNSFDGEAFLFIVQQFNATMAQPTVRGDCRKCQNHKACCAVQRSRTCMLLRRGISPSDLFSAPVFSTSTWVNHIWWPSNVSVYDRKRRKHTMKLVPGSQIAIEILMDMKSHQVKTEKFGESLHYSLQKDRLLETTIQDIDFSTIFLAPDCSLEAVNATSTSQMKFENHFGAESILFSRGKGDSKPVTIYAVFSGREEHLRLQLPYINKLLQFGNIDEVHFADYTCKSQESQSANRAYLKSIASTSDKIFIASPLFCVWNDYYDFYASSLRGDDVLIKADDDIVFVDHTRFSGLIHSMRRHPEVFLWSANVVNNGKSAVFQSWDGTLRHVNISAEEELGPEPHHMGALFLNASVGIAIHQEFVTHPTRFFVSPSRLFRRVRSRISINFIAILGQNLGRASHYVNKASGDDEHALTRMASSIPWNETLIIYMPLVVSHASFGPQKIGANVSAMYDGREIRNTLNWSLPENVSCCDGVDLG
jgi:hypothetical protein